MAESKNDYYKETLDRMSDGKDSVIEVGEITSFDTETLTASVLGLRTKEVKKDVIVTFPNLFMNSGVLLFPLNKTRGLLYVGPENQNYFLPANFHLPHMDSDKVSGEAKIDASPEKIDPLINFSDYEQGEYLFRHISGSQMVFRNNGTIEISNNKSHNLTIDSANGELQQVFESIASKVGHSRFSNKVVQPKRSGENARHVMKFNIKENGPSWHSIVPVSMSEAIKNLKGDLEFDEIEETDLVTFNLINVLDENGNPILSELDQTELFMDVDINFDDVHIKKQITKGGAETKLVEGPQTKKKKVSLPSGDVYEIINQDGSKITIDTSSKGFSLKTMGSGSPKEINVNSSRVSIKNGSSFIEVEQGDVKLKGNNGTTSVNEIINWMNR